jgi:hypothetical protein
MNPSLARLAIALVIATSIVASSARAARAYCLIGDSWQGHPHIPVFHAPHMVDHLQHVDGTPWTETELIRELEWIVTAINASSNSGLPTVFHAGQSHPCPAGGGSCRIPGAINIVPQDAPDCATHFNGSPSGGIIIELPRVNGDCPNPQTDHMGPPGSFGRRVLQGVLNHELGHAFGLWHSHEGCDGLTCDTAQCSVMGSLSFEGWMFTADDVEGLRDLYGFDWYDVRTHLESLDGTAWTDMGFVGMDWQPGFALSSSTSPFMAAVTRSEPGRKIRAYRWDWGPLTWSDLGEGGVATQGSVGAAFDPVGGRTLSQHLVGETPETVTKSFMLHEQLSPLVWTRRPWAGETTRRHGVTLARDPRTGALVQAWRTNEAQIRLQVIDTGPGGSGYLAPVSLPVGAPHGAQLQAYDTPSVACGEAAIELNCIAVWADPAVTGTSNFHTLRWVHFSLAQGPSRTITAGPVMGSGNVLHSPPAVAYKGPAASDSAFVVAWVEHITGATPKFRVRTARKSATGGAWSVPVAHPVRSTSIAFGLGSANLTAELIEAF